MKDSKVKIKLVVIIPKNTECTIPIYEATTIKFDTHQTTIPNL
jgi:hypothetical protein